MLVAVNESYSVYNRAGSRLKGPMSLGDLFQTTDSTFDPRALYDTARDASSSCLRQPDISR